jgi:hypothetical protein
MLLQVNRDINMAQVTKPKPRPDIFKPRPQLLALRPNIPANKQLKPAQIDKTNNIVKPQYPGINRW